MTHKIIFIGMIRKMCDQDHMKKVTLILCQKHR